ncbi:hypothetical protein ACIQ57_03445 [Lysinibacillus xylanilyticus]|uniref:hypothetical protein n=1 Tax=Lysinibacillus xylanilyticus TaxID=582475 RepID=UPI00382A347A
MGNTVKNNKAEDNIENYSNEALFCDLGLYHKVHVDCTDFEHTSQQDYDSKYGTEFTVYEIRYSKQFNRLINFMLDTKNVLMFCPLCNERLSFQLDTVPLSKELKDPFLDGYADYQIDDELYTSEVYRMSERIRSIISENGMFDKLIRCTHDSSHVFKFSYMLQKEGTYPNEFLTLTKIGQYPSIRDLNIGNIKPYQKLLKKYKKEYTTALELHSAGIGIGSFVYLRRIIEVLVENAFSKAVKDGKITKDEYEDEKVRERIKLLRDYLPPFIVDHTHIYKILSKGIHELDEEECNDMFPVLKKSIDFILDEEIEIQTREKDVNETSKKLGQMNSQNTIV